jgi:hypothetical protein
MPETDVQATPSGALQPNLSVEFASPLTAHPERETTPAAVTLRNKARNKERVFIGMTPDYLTEK